MNFYNRVKFTTATTGTGTLTVGSAEAGFRTPAQASVPTGTIVRYKIEDTGNAWEIGYGVYTSAGTTLSRTVSQSSNSDSAINLSGSAVVAFIHAAQDSDTIDPYGIHHRLDTPHADDDEFNDSASLAADWTQVTPSGTTNWEISHHVLAGELSSQLGGDLAAVVKAATLADGESFETCYKVFTDSGATHTMVGLVISDGAVAGSNALVFMTYHPAADVLRLGYNVGTITNIGSLTTDDVYNAITGHVRMRLKRNSSTSFSMLMGTADGVKFKSYSGWTVNPGFTPTHAGVFATTFGGSHTMLPSFDYFRHIT